MPRRLFRNLSIPPQTADTEIVRPYIAIRRFALALICQAANAISWVGGSSKTITFTKGTNVGVIYIATDHPYSSTDSVAVVSGNPPAGIIWASYGSCSSGMLCTAYYGT